MFAEMGGGEMEEFEPCVEVLGAYDDGVEGLRATNVVPSATNEGAIKEGRKIAAIVEDANHLADHLVGKLLHI